MFIDVVFNVLTYIFSPNMLKPSAVVADFISASNAGFQFESPTVKSSDN